MFNYSNKISRSIKCHFFKENEGEITRNDDAEERGCEQIKGIERGILFDAHFVSLPEGRKFLHEVTSIIAGGLECSCWLSGFVGWSFEIRC